MSELAIPRCEHGNIILGCPLDDCEKQNAYLLEQSAAFDRFEALQREEAARLVRKLIREASDLT